MDDFRGTVSLDEPFLDQEEIADFLQISPQSPFPRVILYRFLSVVECFIQANLNEQSSETELVGLRLNCGLLKKGSLTGNGTLEPEIIGSYWVAWGAESVYDEVPDPIEALETTPETPLSHEDLDQLISRIYEVLIAQVPDDLKEQIDIVTSLDINLITSKSEIERRLGFPGNFIANRLDSDETILRRFRRVTVRPCCATNINYKRNQVGDCNFQDPC